MDLFSLASRYLIIWKCVLCIITSVALIKTDTPADLDVLFSWESGRVSERKTQCVSMDHLKHQYFAHCCGALTSRSAVLPQPNTHFVLNHQASLEAFTSMNQWCHLLDKLGADRLQFPLLLNYMVLYWHHFLKLSLKRIFYFKMNFVDLVLWYKIEWTHKLWLNIINED